MDNLRIYFVTWNIGTESSSEQNLHELLSLDEDPEKDQMLPDFYVISLQEVKALPHNILVDIIFEDPWTNAFTEILERRNYIKVKTIRLQGILLSVYGLRRHLLNLREIETQYTRTGMAGLWGNKGGVSVRLGIYGCSICFVNAHLAAHDDHLDDRVDDYNDIIKDQEFHVNDNMQILHHDYVFWMGDLNFRLSEDFDMSPEEIESEIKKGNLQPLLDQDQLQEVMRKGLAFSELTENLPSFPPTFKFDEGTNDYDYKRKPAWTDRILYKVGTNENVTLEADQQSYRCHSNYTLSDHRPVTSEFTIKVRTFGAGARARSLFGLDLQDTASGSEDTERVVVFDPVKDWILDEDNCAEYMMSHDDDTEGDWIGLFKENFNSLDEYVAYVYVKASSSHEDSDEEPPKQRKTVKFPDGAAKHPGMFRLVYFSQSNSHVQSVLGMSEPFQIQEKEED